MCTYVYKLHIVFIQYSSIFYANVENIILAKLQSCKHFQIDQNCMPV